MFVKTQPQPPAPSRLDRAINWALPEWGVRRALARSVLNSYQGGVPTRTSEGWPSASGFRFGNASDRDELGSARSRAYQAYRNNPVARSLVQIETDNVIGDGLNYQPTSSDEEWNREAKDKYYEWLEVASVRGSDVETGCELQRLIWSRSRVAGDIGWILVNSDYLDPDSGQLVIQSRVQVVRSENLSTPDKLLGDAAVYDGIRFDSRGRPLEFFVKSEDERGMRNWATVTARDFVFLPHYGEEGQARGESCYLTIFELLSHLSRYIDGVSLASWMATVMGIVFKQNNAAKQLAALPTLNNSQGDQQKAITFENGMVKYIGTDEEVAQVQAHQPMAQTPDFIRAMMRQIGQPFHMPLEVFALDMSTCNFASARIGLLPFYRHCRINAGRFGSRWSRTIQWWLSREQHRMDGDPKKWKNAFPADFFNHDLLVNAWSYTDPVREAQGDFIELDMKTKSPQMVIAERGRDPHQIMKDWEEWGNLTKDMPQVFSTLSRDAKPDPMSAPAPADGGGDASGNATGGAGYNAFSQSVVLKLLEDRDKRDVLHNISDVPALFTDAGVKLDPSIDSANGEGIPLLPDVPDEPAQETK